MKLYSPSTRGFYDNSISPIIPQDAVEISDDFHAQLIAGQAQGKQIVPGTDGTPILRDPPGPTPDQAWAILRASRDYRLAASDWTQQADSPLDPTKVTAWKIYRQALRDLPSSTPDPLNPVWPAIPA